jgi:RNA polymerase sigma-70 factor (ECF subfamily)
MDENEWLADRFEEHRAHLRAVAYRMLGSLTEADDAVQDTWLRLSRSGAGEVENLGGWLTTIVARVCLNMLRSRNLRREESLAVHLPDPVISPDAELQPEEEALLADSVGLALLVVLDTLAPAERLAFVLHDLFELPFEEIAPMVGRTPAAARQLASRARRRVKGADVPAPDPDSPASERWSAPSSRLRAAAISTPSSPCSTPTSCCESTPARSAPRPPWRSMAQPP